MIPILSLTQEQPNPTTVRWTTRAEGSSQAVLSFNQPDTVSRYFEQSDIYAIRGGFEAELIMNPFLKFNSRIQQEQVVRDLQWITMAAFGKSMALKDVYAPEEIIMKNAIMVDWLTVIRKDGNIVAYTSASMIENDLIYLNASMVHPEFQRHGGLGILPHLYLLRKIMDENEDVRHRDLKVVVRSRNKSVVKVMARTLQETRLSGDLEAEEEFHQIFEKTAKLTECEYDRQDGILRNVYPVDLPTGLRFIGTGRYSTKLEQILSRLGTRDAIFIAGKADYFVTNKLLSREVEEVRVSTRKKTWTPELITVAAA